MKHAYTLAFLLAAFHAHAQITIGQAEMPGANDALARVQAAPNPLIDYAATGPAHTWDFTDLAANAEDVALYQTVASTNFVYAIVYADLPFNADRANHAKQGTDIAFSQLLPVDNPYTFRYRSATTYRTVGYGVELQGLPLPIVFDAPDEIYALPLDYGDASASHSAYHIDIPDVGYYGYEQDRTNAVDGWGGITTPGGTFDVLRVKTTIVGHDSLFGFAVDRPVTHEYKWLAQGLKVPVLQVNTITVFGTEIVNAIYYYDVPRSITVVDPLAMNVCPGATVPVHYESTGAFNAGGFFVPANHFTAQLSDAAGSFAAPVVIGDVTATASGTITATIPADTPPGTGYRIRVVSTSPDFIGTSNAFGITIGGTPVAAITADGPALICTGDTLTLTAVGGPGYQWQVDGTDIADATDGTYAATEAGSYTVVVVNGCGTAASNAITVAVNAPPVYTLSGSNFGVCPGGEVAITALDQSGQEPLTYQWYLNDAPIVDATDSTWTATLPGQYTLEVTNATTGCTYATSGANVAGIVTMPPMFATPEDTSFCAGDTLVLQVAAYPLHTFDWFLDGVLLPDPPVYGYLDVTVPGTYTATSNAGICVSAPSEPLVVTMLPAPEMPVVTAMGDTAFCAGGSVTLAIPASVEGTLQWYLDGGGIIVNATDTELVVTATGNYTVTVTGDNGCSATNDPAVGVVVNPLPAVPVITSAADSLLIDDAGTYEWSLDGTPIDGATDAWWLPAENGSYTVTVTDANGCSSTSEPYVWVSTGVATVTTGTLQAVPNPSNGTFTIELPGARGEAYEMMDATGQRVSAGRLTGIRTLVDLTAAGQGMYFLHVLQNGSTPVLRIVVAR